MKILFVVPRFHTNMYQMVKTLQENGHQVTFHASCLGFTEDHSLVKPVTFKQCKASLLTEKIWGRRGVNRPNYFPGPIQYWRVFRKIKPDIIIIRDPYRPFSLIAAICSLLTKTKIVFYTQEILFGPQRKRISWKRNFIIKFFRAAWMVPIQGGEDDKQHALKYSYYVPLPVPSKPGISINRNSTAEKPRILMMGKYHQARKNHLLFVKAISILKNKYQFKVTIVGECINEEQIAKFNLLQETIADLGLSEIIFLKKNIPFSKMEDLYTSHHVFVLPAINEQYGVSVTEALAYGLPTICTDTCGARFNISNGVNGFVVESNSLEELTTAMETLISNSDKLNEMREQSLAYFEKNLSGSAFYSRFLYMLKDRFYH
ncbi:MAG: glycosyltransferase [Flavisolibacter sp.]|nr:glycosyltransferase [Flavisolibacter sp.]